MASQQSSELGTLELPTECNYLAPDGSEIRLLSEVRGGMLAPCMLPPGKTTKAVLHRTIEDIWYCLSGEGQIWRRLGQAGKPTHAHHHDLPLSVVTAYASED